MSTTTEIAPLKKGDVFLVLSYVGEPESSYISRRFVCSWVGDYHVTGYGAETAFMFSEVRRVEPTEQERGLENYLLEDGNE